MRNVTSEPRVNTMSGNLPTHSHRSEPHAGEHSCATHHSRIREELLRVRVLREHLPRDVVEHPHLFVEGAHGEELARRRPRDRLDAEGVLVGNMLCLHEGVHTGDVNALV